jgi:hypothetical protein
MGLGRLEICRSGVVVEIAVFDSASGVLGSVRLGLGDEMTDGEIG